MADTQDPSYGEHFRSLARYNRWANERIYEAVAGLNEAERTRQRPAAFFGSILGTLNHILVGDRIWLDRIDGVTPALTQLDQILHHDLSELRATREAEDLRIIAVVERLADGDLSRPLEYRRLNGDPMSEPHGRVLTHFFNHQTHHRGQAHALVKEAGAEPPSLDYIYFTDVEG